MRHPEIAQWADFVRALVTDAERAQLEAHLEQGCRLCRATIAALERVADAVNADLTVALPSGALRSVKAFFSVQHREARGGWQEVQLRPAYDSSTEPAPAGSRGPDEGRRQLLFESERYTVELSLDRASGAAETVLRGQILESEGRPRSHAAIFLVGDGEVLGRAISEPQGTFQMSGRLDPSCELWLFPDDDSRIRLSLDSRR